MPMSQSAIHRPSGRPAQASYFGPVTWQAMVQWLLEEGVISVEEEQRTVARCSSAERSLHPLVRLASVGMRRAADGR